MPKRHLLAKTRVVIAALIVAALALVLSLNIVAPMTLFVMNTLSQASPDAAYANRLCWFLSIFATVVVFWLVCWTCYPRVYPVTLAQLADLDPDEIVVTDAEIKEFLDSQA